MSEQDKKPVLNKKNIAFLNKDGGDGVVAKPVKVAKSKVVPRPPTSSIKKQHLSLNFDDINDIGTPRISKDKSACEYEKDNEFYLARKKAIEKREKDLKLIRQREERDKSNSKPKSKPKPGSKK